MEAEASTVKRRAVLLTVCGPKIYGLMKNLLSPIRPAEKGYEELCTLLQALGAELKAGFMVAMQVLARIEDTKHFLNERVQAYELEWQEQLKQLKDTVRTFKEELQGTTTQIRELSERQEEKLQQDRPHSQKKTGPTSAQNGRTWNWEDQNTGEKYPADPALCRMYVNYEPRLNKRYSVSLPHSTFQKVVQNTDMEGGHNSPVNAHPRHELISPVLRNDREFQELVDTGTMKEYSDSFKELNQSRYASRENGLETNHLTSQLDSKNIQHLKEKYPVERLQATVELLKSERTYALYLSFILKTNITARGKSVVLNGKDLSNILPSSLRVLTQLHTALLCALEERLYRWQWQGIVGDIFMKLLDNDENKFLDNYIIYLKELPECISTLNICSGDSLKLTMHHEDKPFEAKPDLLTLLVQPIHRIPEYILLLQNILKHTELDHPDYYLLPLCTRRFQIFLSRYSHLLQHNEQLLKQNRKDLKRCVVPQVQQSKLKGLEQIQCLKSDEWEFTPRRYQRLDNLDSRPLYTSDLELEPKSAPVKSFSEAEYQAFCEDTNLNNARSIPSHANHSSYNADPICSLENYVMNFAPDYQDFLYRGSGGRIGYQEQEAPIHHENEESIKNASLLDQCSVRSSDSSLDVHFMKMLNYIPARESEITDYSLQLTSCHSGSHDDLDNMYRHHCCEAGHGIFFNETQSENYSSVDYTSEPIENQKIPVSLMLCNTGSPSWNTNVADPSQVKLSRTKSSQRAISSSPRSKDYSNQTSDVWMESENFQDNSAMAIILDEAGKLYNKEENKQTALSEQSKKQDQKGGFRNSFRKLFRKKSNQSLESKQKSDGNPTQDATMTENQEFKERAAHVNSIDRGTAV
uniref:rho guanine nucleotide exchange factor 33 n=1 Tax=Pristiophorus japonicus TaxID=55135 RepID=UPI00398F7F35